MSSGVLPHNDTIRRGVITCTNSGRVVTLSEEAKRLAKVTEEPQSIFDVFTKRVYHSFLKRMMRGCREKQGKVKPLLVDECECLFFPLHPLSKKWTSNEQSSVDHMLRDHRASGVLPGGGKGDIPHAAAL